VAISHDDGEPRYTLSAGDGRRVAVAERGTIRDLTAGADRFHLALADGGLAAYAIPDGRRLWYATGDRITPEGRDRAEIWLGGGCVWTVERGPGAALWVRGRDGETGELVVDVALAAALRGVAGADGGIVVELADAVVFVDRGGATTLAAAPSPGRDLLGDGVHVLGLDRRGRDVWVVAPGRKFMWWACPRPATGLVVEDSQVRVDTADGSFAFPFAAFAAEEALGAGEVVALRRCGAPAPRGEEPAAPAQGDVSLRAVEVRGARIDGYRGFYDPSGGLVGADCCDLAVGVDEDASGVAIGLFTGWGGQRTGDVAAFVARYALQSIVAGPAIAAPEPRGPAQPGSGDEAELLVRCWVDRGELPREPVARLEAIAARIGRVIDRIAGRWYGPHRSLGADGALVWFDGRRAAVLVRGAARAYVVRSAAATVLLREHTLAAQHPEVPPEYADLAMTVFSAEPNPALAGLPSTAEVELAAGDRLAVVVGRALSRPDAAIDALVDAADLRAAAARLEADGPAFALNKWGALRVTRA
jgi:hypothetical protein